MNPESDMTMAEIDAAHAAFSACIRSLVTEHCGARCPEIEPGCPVCRVWALVDLITGPAELMPEVGCRMPDAGPSPYQAMVRRLRELSRAVTQGPKAVAREFTMRVPAEPERDADLVLDAAASVIEGMAREVVVLRELVRDAAQDKALLDSGMIGIGQTNHFQVDLRAAIRRLVEKEAPR